MRKFIVIIVFLITSLTSCNKFLFENFSLKQSGVNAVSKFEHKENNKEVIFLPVVHIAREEFYQNIKHYLDSMKSEGYVVFYEGVQFPEHLDDSTRDTLSRKFRKIGGFHLTKYDDKNNKSLPRFVRKNKEYVIQTRENIGVVTENDIWVDLNMQELIAKFEENKGEIILDKYDFMIGLNEKYEQSKEDKQYKTYMLLSVRNEHIVNQVVDSEHNKIVLIYGKSHLYDFIHFFITKLDYTIVR